ncbi:MAG: acyl-CoA dehydrogenase, partial [Brachybacterium sp.]|nr:acyl-CoA dehydrogenase [Brachybacterium sp.]
LVVTGAALHAHRQGADSGAAILRDAADGHLFAFGISEPGNEAMLFDSFTTSARDGEDLLLHGTKIFTSLSPVWTRLVMHAALPLEETADAADGDARLVFGVLERGEGIEIANDWDTHGMRATQSATTRLDGARLPAGRILTTTPVGPNLDPFVFGIFGVFELLLAAVYTGIAERAVEVGTQIATTRRSRTRDIVHADDPDIRWRIADAAIRADGARLQIEKVAADLDRIGDADVPEPGPRWFLDFSGVKSRATESAIAAVDQVLRASGGSHYFRGSELERLSRDVRAGMYHPSDEESVHASYAKALLGELGSR